MVTQKVNFEKVKKFMKFVANFLKIAYYMVKLLNFEP